jgi:hypothetical protein
MAIIKFHFFYSRFFACTVVHCSIAQLLLGLNYCMVILLPCTHLDMLRKVQYIYDETLFLRYDYEYHSREHFDPFDPLGPFLCLFLRPNSWT